LRRIDFVEGRHSASADPAWEEDVAGFGEIIDQLNRYFAGDLKNFTLPMAPEGTNFQRRVWQNLCDIPYGETISYGQLAQRIGNPNASRAVGLANGSNPIPIIIPCHRVIGSNGKLTGYGGGLPIKEKLLALERQQLRLL
jgi:methylated-DNA-[protein]-cysteine S-methyltransferase